jgi:predicted metal-dependent hydrolase
MDRGGSRTTRLGTGLTGDLFPVATVEEPRRIVLRGREVTYRLKRSQRRRRVAFLVDERGLSVHAPWRASDRLVEEAIVGATRWILAKLDEWARKPRAPERTWRDGAPLEYLGRPLALALAHDPHLTLTELTHDARLEVRLPRPDDADAVRAAVVRWYRRHAERHFPDRVAHFAERLGVERPRLFLSDAATRWGSCNARREVRLNWRLMQAPERLVDYVVAHELAHLLHLNHSARFWRVVERIYPDYPAARTELAAVSRHYMSL